MRSIDIGLRTSRNTAARESIIHDATTELKQATINGNYYIGPCPTLLTTLKPRLREPITKIYKNHELAPPWADTLKCI